MIASIVLAACALAMTGCVTPQPARSSFFQRYTPADPAAFEREIIEVRAEVAQLRTQGRAREALRAEADLGGMLVSARKEQAAKALLEQTLREARQLQAQDAAGWALLYLATANQYLRLSTAATSQFDEALSLATVNSDPELEHYVYHHRGRLKVELGDLAGARSDFDRALAIRVRLGDREREKSTLRALQALDSSTDGAGRCTTIFCN